MGFTQRLKTALVGKATARFVFIGNIEVERVWGNGAVGLPRMSFGASDIVVNRMDELALTLAGPDDYVVLKTAPDPDYLAYLAELGLGLPTVIAVGEQQPRRTVTEDALADGTTLAALAALATPDTYLLPHGVSEREEELAARTGLALAAPGAAVCRAVNSKVYSRRLADSLGLRQPFGWACDNRDELGVAVAEAEPLLAAGRRFVIKDAFGVSGKGIVVVDDAKRLDRLRRMVDKEAQRDPGGELAVVVEEWVAKDVDLNYQFTIGSDGQVAFDFVKRAVTDNGVHKGHQMPAGLTPAQDEVVRDAAQRIGTALRDAGFHGVVGVDAMLDPDGGVYPVTEINARHNMSTYQATITERLIGADSVALARHYELTLTQPLPFDQVRRRLDGLLFGLDGEAGLIINAFATVNAAAECGTGGSDGTGGSFGGRLYGIVVAADWDECDDLNKRIEGAIRGQ